VSIYLGKRRCILCSIQPLYVYCIYTSEVHYTSRNLEVFIYIHKLNCIQLLFQRSKTYVCVAAVPKDTYKKKPKDMHFYLMKLIYQPDIIILILYFWTIRHVFFLMCLQPILPINILRIFFHKFLF